MPLPELVLLIADLYDAQYENLQTAFMDYGLYRLMPWARNFILSEDQFKELRKGADGNERVKRYIARFMRRNYTKEQTSYQYNRDQNWSVYYQGRPKVQKLPGQRQRNAADRRIVRKKPPNG